jgi:hypothetical protein
MMNCGEFEMSTDDDATAERDMGKQGGVLLQMRLQHVADNEGRWTWWE